MYDPIHKVFFFACKAHLLQTICILGMPLWGNSWFLHLWADEVSKMRLLRQLWCIKYNSPSICLLDFLVNSFACHSYIFFREVQFWYLFPKTMLILYFYHFLEQLILNEYEDGLKFEEEKLCAAIQCLQTDELICPICKQYAPISARWPGNAQMDWEW